MKNTYLVSVDQRDRDDRTSRQVVPSQAAGSTAHLDVGTYIPDSRYMETEGRINDRGKSFIYTQTRLLVISFNSLYTGSSIRHLS